MVRSPQYLALRTVLLLLLGSVIGYVVLRQMPGDPLEAMLQNNSDFTYQDYMRLRDAYGLDDSPAIGYLKWAGQNLRGNAGYSRQYKVPVHNLVAPRVLNTGFLLLAAIAYVLVIGTLLGAMYLATDHAPVRAAVHGLAILASSLPAFIMALMMIVLFSVTTRWLPPGGIMSSDVAPDLASRMVDRLKYLVMPGFVLSLALLGSAVRCAIDQAATEPRTFGANIRRWAQTLAYHVTTRLGPAFAGTVIVEAVFSYPGIGKLLFDSAMGTDFVVVVVVLTLMFDVGVGVAFIWALGRSLRSRTVREVATARAELESRRLHPRVAVWMGALGAAGIALFCLVGPLVSPYDPYAENHSERFTRPSLISSTDSRAPSAALNTTHAHLLGADDVGRDVATRAMYGGRVALAIGMAVATIGVALSWLVYKTTDRGRGLWSSVLGDYTAALEASIPDVALVLIALKCGGFTSLLLILGVIGLAANRERRAALPSESHSLRRGSGSPWLLSGLLAVVALCVARAISVEAPLSYLGAGVPPPLFTWGTMFANAQQYFPYAPWVAFTPPVLLVATLLSTNILADGLRQPAVHLKADDERRQL